MTNSYSKLASEVCLRSVLLASFAMALVFMISTAPAGAVCLANGKPCGAPIAANDRLCCPGSVCGPWGNQCQPGCRISGTAYRSGDRNPANPCQACQPVSSTTAWTNVPSGTSCSDNNRCTQTDRCQAGTCVGSNPVVCSASDACHVAGVCNPATGACSNPVGNNGAACNDGNGCTQTDTCSNGSCVGGNPIVCAVPADPCKVQATCNPATGSCPGSPNGPDGTACNDGNPCTQTDTCQAGSCVGSNEVVCPADSCNDPCHVAGTCDPSTGVCSHPNAPNGTPCKDPNLCSLYSCVDGTCTESCPNPYHDHCSNGQQDCGEEGVDCGTTCGTVCGPGFCPGPCTAVACIDPGQESANCGSSGIFDQCLCSQTTEGFCFCAETPAIGLALECTTSAECPSNELCVPYCYPINLCSPPCGTNPFRFAGRGQGANPAAK